MDIDKAIDLEAIRRNGGVVEENAVASILSIGDGVFCVEFRSKMNAMDRDVLAMLERGVRRAETHGAGVVVANEGRVFSAGANLALIASDIEARAFDRIEQLLLAFQRSFTAVKYAAVPVVAAPRVKALGGGVSCAFMRTRSSRTPTRAWGSWSSRSDSCRRAEAQRRWR